MFKELCLATALQLSPMQVDVVNESYYHGSEYNLGYSLAAISIVESSAGKNKFNPNSLDFGVHQINLKTAMKREKVENFWGFISLVTKLYLDDKYNASMAIKELRFCQGQYGSEYRKIWASYNAGYNIPAGMTYSNKIANNIKTLKKCNTER